MREASYDAAIVGAGPNGLAGAAVLATAGLSVVVLERNGRIALLERNTDEMASTQGEDSRRWDRLMRPFVDRHEAFFESIIRPIRAFRAVAHERCAM